MVALGGAALLTVIGARPMLGGLYGLFGAEGWGELLASDAAFFAVMVLVNALCSCGAETLLRGKAFRLGAEARRAVKRLPAAIPTALVAALAFTLAMVLPVVGLIGLMLLAFGEIVPAHSWTGTAPFVFAGLFAVPSLIAACAAYVAVPACLIEGRGPLAAFSRSRALTKGARWGVFGLLLLTAIVILAASPILGGIVIAISEGLSAGPGMVWGGAFAVFATATLVAAEATILLFILPMAMFHKLRLAKDGVSGESLTGVFE